MSLTAREEQILGSMEDGLARSDPKLAWMLGTFSRLASGEEMPVREKIHPARLVANLRGRPHPHRDAARRSVRGLYQPRGSPPSRVLWLATVVPVALVAVALAISRSGSGNGQRFCTQSSSAVCAAPVSAHPSGSGAHKAAPDQFARAG